VTADQLAVGEKMVRLHGQDHWLYGAVDSKTNEILHIRLFPTTTKQTMRWFLDELHRRYQLDDVVFLVDDADYLGPVLAEDGYRFQMVPHGNRNAIERVFWEVERRTSSFANSFSHVTLETAESWLEAFVVYTTRAKLNAMVGLNHSRSYGKWRSTYSNNRAPAVVGAAGRAGAGRIRAYRSNSDRAVDAAIRCRSASSSTTASKSATIVSVSSSSKA